MREAMTCNDNYRCAINAVKKIEFHEVMLIVWDRTCSPEDSVVNFLSLRYTSVRTALVVW